MINRQPFIQYHQVRCGRRKEESLPYVVHYSLDLISRQSENGSKNWSTQIAEVNYFRNGRTETKFKWIIQLSDILCYPFTATMSSRFFKTDVYCTQCNLQFPDVAARAKHIESSWTHPFCIACNRRFMNWHTLSVVSTYTYPNRRMMNTSFSTSNTQRYISHPVRTRKTTSVIGRKSFHKIQRI